MNKNSDVVTPTEKVNHHAWRRFFARFVDSYTLGVVWINVVVIVLLYCFSLDISEFGSSFSVGSSNFNWISIWIEMILWIPIEATLLSMFGTTPAKWLFGIEVKTNDGNNPSFQKALKRSFLVALRGLSLTIFTMAFAGDRILKTGIASWDNDTDLVVSHKHWSITRTTLCTVATLFAFTIFAVLKEINKLPPKDVSRYSIASTTIDSGNATEHGRDYSKFTLSTPSTDEKTTPTKEIDFTNFSLASSSLDDQCH